VTPTDTVQPLLSRLFDRTVMAVGVVVAFASATIAVADGLQFSWQYWLSVPLIVIIARFPLVIERPSGAIEIGFDSCVLAFVLSMLEPHDAMLIWSAGAVLSQALSNIRRVAKIFNTGVMLTAGATAIALVDALRGSSRGTPLELAAVAVGCGAYFLIDYIVSEVSIALEEGAPLYSQLGHPDVAIALACACMVAVDSLGYLAALIVRGLPLWSVTLLAVPVVTLLIAVTSVARGRETARRTAVLLQVSREVQALHTERDVLSAVEAGAQQLLKGLPVQLRALPPRDNEVGALLPSSSGDQWLVTPHRSGSRATPAADRQNLEALALVGHEALARLQMTREMTHLAEHDALTELANRSFFMRRLDAALERCRGGNSRVAVLFCDLDGFKRVNDWFGHAAGDALLVDVATTLSAAVGPGDIVARLGGDEFGILVESVASDDDLESLSESVLRAVDRRYEFGGRFVTISTSIGVAFSDGAHSGDQLIRNADIAMYEAKEAGRNQVMAYHPALGRERVRSLEHAEALRHALENHDLHLVYQPVFQSSSNRIVGVEALVRWSHDGELLLPDRFIGLAEESGLADMLGEHVLELVAADAPELHAASGGELSIGVNVSAQQLRAPGFVPSVLRTRDALDGLTLVLEITERQVIGDDPLVRSVIRELEANGVKFALDDFGIGYSSIGYLQQLGVQVLKTDRLFSAGIDTDLRSIRLLVSMIEMGRALGLEVVVEGIERESQVDVLRHTVGFADNLYLQGYLFSQPVALSEVVRAVRECQPLELRAV